MPGYLRRGVALLGDVRLVCVKVKLTLSYQILKDLAAAFVLS